MEERERREMKIIVGLGNPGKEYENTRHNIGFAVLDKLQTEIFKSQFSNPKQIQNFKFQKHLQSDILRMDDVVLAKPQTYMNKSGVAVRKLIENCKLKIENLYVVHDDLDIKLGEYKIQLGKGPKVHNGISSIEKALGTKDFWRVRIGIDDNDVLGKFLPEEKKIIEGVIDEVNKAIVERL